MPASAIGLGAELRPGDWEDAGLWPISLGSQVGVLPHRSNGGDLATGDATSDASRSAPPDIVMLGSSDVVLSPAQLKLLGQLVRNVGPDELVVIQLGAGRNDSIGWRRWCDDGLRVFARCLLGHRVVEGDSVVMAGDASTVSGLLGKFEGEPTVQTVLTEARIAGIHLQAIQTGRQNSHSSDESVDATAVTGTSLLSTIRQFGVVLRSWWNQVLFPYQPSVDAPKTLGFLGSRLASFVIVMLFAVVLFARLGYPLFEPDEARNAQLALNASQSGEWTSLRLLDEPYWDKPPFQSWMTMAAYGLFGETPWSTRLPCAIMGLMTAIAIMTLGAKLTDRATANLASLLLLGCLGFAVISRYATMDATLCCLATWMILWILLATGGATATRSVLTWSGIGALAGVALLAKGLAIIAIAFPPTVMFFWLRRDTLVLPSRKAVLFAAASCFAIAGPWYLAMTLFHPDFAVYFFGKHHLMRFANAFDHNEPWWYYFPVAWILMYPTSLLLPVLAGSWWYGKSAWRSRLPQVTDGLLLYAAWVFGFFTLAEAKLPTYILPMLPIACLLSAITLRFAPWKQIAERKQKSVSEWKLGLSKTVLVSIGLVQSIGLLTVGLMFRNTLDGHSLVAMLAMETVVLLLIVAGSMANTLPWRNAWAGMACFAFIATAVLIAVPTVSTQKSTLHALAREAQMIGSRPVVYYGRPPFATQMIDSDLNIYHIDDDHPEAAARFLANNPDAVLITGRGSLRRIEEELGTSDAFLPINGHRRLHEIRPGERSQVAGRFNRTDRIHAGRQTGNRTAGSPGVRR